VIQNSCCATRTTEARVRPVHRANWTAQPASLSYIHKHIETQNTHPPCTIHWGVLLPRPQISATVVSRSRLSVRCLAWVLRCQIAPRATHPLGPFTPTVTWIERSEQYIQISVGTIMP